MSLGIERTDRGLQKAGVARPKSNPLGCVASSYRRHAFTAVTECVFNMIIFEMPLHFNRDML